MKLSLASSGNPDYGQDPTQPFHGCNEDTLIEVNTFKEASILCRQYISENNLGSGNWAGGEIFEGAKVIAQVSYNGRVWQAGAERKEI